MKKNILFFIVVLLSLSCFAKEERQSADESQSESAELKIEWDRANVVSWRGEYCRVHRLNDSRLMAVYSEGGKGCYRLSSDNGVSWSGSLLALDRTEITDGIQSVWTDNANSEFAQLSAVNPYHPGRIIYASNIRPSGQRSDVFPYSIAYAFSDDNGESWSERRLAYQSLIWETAALKGCWEPYVLELPDGTVQIYFADETPYYRNGYGYQNISVVESKDGGDSWGSARIVAYTEEKRDGMPVAMLYNDNIYLVVEHYLSGERFHPEVVWNPASKNWKNTVFDSYSTYRFDPMKTPLDFINNYYGSPYLIATDNYFVLSYQSSEGASEPNTSHAVMEVVVCPKSEFKKNAFRTMRAASRPVQINQQTGKALWNSLCDLGDDNVLAVSDVSGKIYLTRGKISGK